MLMRVQWATRTPRDYVAMPPTAWANLPARPDPRSTGPVGPNDLDDTPGLFAAVKVQGVVFTHDHVAVEPLDGEMVRVTAWSDNPTESPPGRREAQVWTFRPLVPWRRLMGRMVPKQTRIVYADRPTMYARWESCMPIENTELREWSEFVPPAAEITRHGIWMTDAHWRRLEQARTPSGWGD